MATISETSDDSSNGGDLNMKPEEPHKNPEEEEEENQNENPKDVNQEDDHQEEEVENLPPIPREIPLELIEKTIAPIRRCHYPSLSLLSNAFRQVISSEDLFQTRSRIGLTELVLYTLISFPPFDRPRWFILHRSNVSLQLTRVTSLPPMFRGCTTVTIGHKMYVMGGCRSSSNRPVKTVFVIDCRFHTWRYLPNMERARCYAASGVIDGQIYVVGGCTKRHDDWIEVFDVTTATWETAPGLVSSLGRSGAKFDVHVVLDDMIYILDGDNCLGYNPRRRSWETWGFESLQWYFWHASCVVDDLLYAVVPNSVLGSPIVVYDPRKMDWRPVMGVDYLPNLVYSESRLANFGGKLVILGCYQSRDSFDCYGEVNVWCVEVALEKHEDGDIWGKVQSLSLVNKFRKSPFFELSRTVTV